MIFYITTHANNKLICEAAEESNQQIIKSIIEAKFCLSEYIKNELSKITLASDFIIDLSVLSDTEDEIIETLNSFKLASEKIKIIIIAPYRNAGDYLLSEIVSLAIYNIVTLDDDSNYEDIKDDLLYCLTEGKRYKDSIKYKVSKSQPIKEKKADKPKTIVKEKIIVKKEIRQTVSKAIIGILGSQNRIGTTHYCLLSASFLKRMGYSVALVEKNSNVTKSFKSIYESLQETIEDHMEENGYFTYNGIDFYPEYELKENYKLQAKGYNFIIQDFGAYESEKDLKELDRCVMQIVVGGYKSWEVDNFNRIFEDAGEERLKQFYYVFTYTSKKFETEVKDCMEGLNNILIAGYTPDPFVDKDEMLEILYKTYIPEVKTEKPSFNIENMSKRIIQKLDHIKKRVLKRGKGEDEEN